MGAVLLIAVLAATGVAVASWYGRRVDHQVRELLWMRRIGDHIKLFERDQGRLPSEEELASVLGKDGLGPHGQRVLYESVLATDGAHWVIVATGSDGALDRPLVAYIDDCINAPRRNVWGEFERDLVIVDGRECQWPVK